MRTVLVKSAPALVVLVVLTIGFTLVNPFVTETTAYTQDDCDAADRTCVSAIQTAYQICDAYRSGSNECIAAQSVAGAACTYATEVCSQAGVNF